LKKQYNFEKDLKNERFEQVWVDKLKAGKYKPKDIKITEGYFPEYDVIADGITYEIKRDYYYQKTKNVLIEEWFDEDKKEGWFYKCKADFLVVFYSETEYYILAMHELKKHFMRYKEVYRKVTCHQSNGYKTINYLIPLAEVKDVTLCQFGSVAEA